MITFRWDKDRAGLFSFHTSSDREADALSKLALANKLQVKAKRDKHGATWLFYDISNVLSSALISRLRAVGFDVQPWGRV